MLHLKSIETTIDKKKRVTTVWVKVSIDSAEHRGRLLANLPVQTITGNMNNGVNDRGKRERGRKK